MPAFTPNAHHEPSASHDPVVGSPFFFVSLDHPLSALTSADLEHPTKLLLFITADLTKVRCSYCRTFLFSTSTARVECSLSLYRAHSQVPHLAPVGNNLSVVIYGLESLNTVLAYRCKLKVNFQVKTYYMKRVYFEGQYVRRVIVSR